MGTIKAIDFRFFIGCACYVPGVDKQHGYILPILSTIDGVNTASNKIIVHGKEYDTIIVKPVLRKFDMLSRHEVEQLNKLWPKENIKRTIHDSILLDAEIINYLTSLSVDVFDWIPKGIAIDAEYNNFGI